MELLIKLNSVELSALRALYQRDWPKNYLGYNTLDNFIRWEERSASSGLLWSAYSLSEPSWRERGIYLIIHHYQLFVNSLQPEDESLGVALRQMQWLGGYKITSIPQQQYGIVTAALQALKINYQGAMMNVYRLSKEEALKRSAMQDTPAGLALRPLRRVDAEQVNGAWPSQQSGSLPFIRDLIEFNVSTCIFCEQSNQMVAWCTRCQCGFLGTLHVRPAQRRRGLATLAINAHAYEVASTLDQDVFSLVYEMNHASNELFRKSGFQLIDNVHHIRAATLNGKK